MACPRCGKPSKIKSNPQGRCAGCLSKLRRNKKNPRRHEHWQKMADDALRRQRGGTENTKPKSNGIADRKEIIAKIKDGYRRNGTARTLSPDRIDNSKGYSSDNVRMVPKEFNRGDRGATRRKVAKWKHLVKSNDLDLDEFSTIVLAKAADAGIESVDLPLMKAEMFHDKESIVEILVDSEDPVAEELIGYIKDLTDEELCGILN